MPLPLSPFTVIEIAGPEARDMHHLALAFAGRIAADLGARVLRLVPADGDPLAAMPVLPWEVSGAPRALSHMLNASKTLVPLDPGHDRAALERLVHQADAVLTVGGFLPDPDFARVTVRLATMPEGHPLADPDAPPFGELALLALTGLLDIVGAPDREPLALGGHQAAHAAGSACFSAMMLGLAGRATHGLGDAFDVSLFDVLAWVNWKGVSGRALGQQRCSTREGDTAEWTVLRAADGWIALVYNERDWPNLVSLVGDPALADPELARPAGRARHRRLVRERIEAWAMHHDRRHIYVAAQALKVPIGPVVEPGEMAQDPQVRARDALATLADGAGGAVTLPRVPVVWSGRRFSPRPPARASLAEALADRGQRHG